MNVKPSVYLGGLDLGRAAKEGQPFANALKMGVFPDSRTQERLPTMGNGKGCVANPDERTAIALGTRVSASARPRS